MKSLIVLNNITFEYNKKILEMFNAKKFIISDARLYKNIEEIGRKLKKIR